MKLTFCGHCVLCHSALLLITCHEYFTDEILGYRGFCKKCKKKTETYKTIEELIKKQKHK